MSLVIWKYLVARESDTVIAIPEGAVVLSVQFQPQHNGNGSLWVLLDPKNKEENRLFRTIGTGIEIKDGQLTERKKYIATWQDNAGFVWHTFEIL